VEGEGAAERAGCYRWGMPSYRVTMVIGALKPGVNPGAVLPLAAAAGRELVTVEASDLAVVAGEARITVRFTADELEIARQVGAHIVAVTDQSARVLRSAVTERVKNRWV